MHSREPRSYPKYLQRMRRGEKILLDSSEQHIAFFFANVCNVCNGLLVKPDHWLIFQRDLQISGYTSTEREFQLFKSQVLMTVQASLAQTTCILINLSCSGIKFKRSSSTCLRSSKNEPLFYSDCDLQKSMVRALMLAYDHTRDPDSNAVMTVKIGPCASS